MNKVIFILICVFMSIFVNCKIQNKEKTVDFKITRKIEKKVDCDKKIEGIKVSNNVVALEIQKGREYDLYNLKSNKVIANVRVFRESDCSIIPVIFNGDTNPNYSFISEDGDVSYKLKLSRCYGFRNGLCVVLLPDFDFALLKPDGSFLDKKFLQLGQMFSENKNFAEFYDGTTGYIDIEGNKLFEIDIDDIDGFLAATGFFNGVAIYKNKKGSWTLIKDDGSKIKDLNINYAEDFSEEYSLVRKQNEKYNFVDVNGNYFSDIDFDYADAFSNGRAKVNLDGKDYYFYKDNSLILEKKAIN